MCVTKQLLVAIDIHSMENKYYESQWLLSTVWLHTFILCTLQQKKEIQTALERHDHD